MRKIDYQHLADAIRAYLESASAQRHANPEFSSGAIAACKGIASQFAASTSVNREEFLRQCGVLDDVIAANKLARDALNKQLSKP